MTPGHRSSRIDERGRTGLRAAGLVVLAAVVAGVGAGVAIHALNAGGGSSARDNPPGLHGQATWNSGGETRPGFSAAGPERPADLCGSLRGRTVMLAFFSSRCHRACAPEARSFARPSALLSPPARPVLVIVSRDPSHDTPQSTRAAVARWGLGAAATWHWLLGSREQLAPVLTAYRVDDRGAGASAIAPVYLIDRGGL